MIPSTEMVLLKGLVLSESLSDEDDALRFRVPLPLTGTTVGFVKPEPKLIKLQINYI